VLVSTLTYLKVMRSGGADSLLDLTGLSGSTFLERTQQLAADYGFGGVVMAGIMPMPTPVVVVGGVLAGIKGRSIVWALLSSRFFKFLGVALAIKLGSGNVSAEEYVRTKFGKEGQLAAE